MQHGLSILMCAGLGLATCSCKADPMVEVIHFPEVGPVSCDGATPLDSAQPFIERDGSVHLVLEDSDAGPLASASICDGSTAVRLAVAAKVQVQSLAFAAPYGLFFVVDGRCHFYAQGLPIAGIREGTLSRSQAQALSADLELAHLADLASTRSTCVEGGAVMIATADASVSCRCGDCGSDAIRMAEAWTQALALRGEPLETPIRAVAAVAEPNRILCYPEQRVLQWPLSRAMQEVTGLILDRYSPSVPGALVDDVNDAMALRQLRADTAQMQLAPGLYADKIFVRDRGTDYWLSIHDELPDTDASGITTFLDSAWRKENDRTYWQHP